MEYCFKPYQKTALQKDHLHLGGENPQGERIAVTNLYVERNGEPWLPVMGEYHFSRASKEDWYRELCKMKAGGITIVSTYLFWIYHEEIEGTFTFSDDCDIRSFVLAARDAGLDVFLRIGPWAHGECRNGGLPDWLLLKNFPVRNSNPGYMRYVKIWYEKIYEQVQGLFYSDGGPIIGIQLENELVNDADHLFDLKTLALQIGFSVPLYTVTGWNSKYGAQIPVDEVLPVFGAYADAPWAKTLNPLPPSPAYTFNPTRNDSAIGEDIIAPDEKTGWLLPYSRYPFATCELGAGIQPSHHRRMIVSGMDAYALSLVKLGCGNNLVGYYMYHGGINQIGQLSTFQESKATGYPNDYPILSYFYHTALTPYGEANEQYRLLNLLHLFIQDFGSSLALMEYVPATDKVKADDPSSLRYCMRTDGDGGFLFISQYQRLLDMQDVNHVTIHTGTVIFPEINVRKNTSFFLPIRMKLGNQILEYATAQPLCRVGQTFFFLEIDGIEPEFQFVGEEPFSPEYRCCAPQSTQRYGFAVYEDIQIVTLPLTLARFARKLSDELYIGMDCDLYVEKLSVTAIQDGTFSYLIWTGDDFTFHTIQRPFHPAELTIHSVDELPFIPTYMEELQMGGERKLTYRKLQVSTKEGFVELSEPCDVEQIYADGQLVADEYYCGVPWRIPAALLYGKECYLVMSELKQDFYREF